MFRGTRFDNFSIVHKHDFQKTLELTIQWDVSGNLQIGNKLQDENAFVIDQSGLTFTTKVGINPSTGSPATLAVEEMGYEIAGHTFLMK